MGKSTKPKYRVDFHSTKYVYPAMGWDWKRYGRPTDASLAKFVADFVASTAPGGPNDHLGDPAIASATVRLNDPVGVALGTWKA